MIASRTVVLALALLSACSVDSEAPAPFVPPAYQPGTCGTTATLLPGLLEFAQTDRFAPLASVLEELSESRGQLSLRTVVQAVVRLLSGLGLDRTAQTVRFQSTHRALDELEPLVITALKLAIGDLDGRPRWEAFEAIGTLVDRCEPTALLSAIEGVLRLEIGGQRWLSLVAKDVSPLLRDPALEPFLETFEQEAARGKPAVIALLNQILGFIIDDNFRVARVETLLESVVYPLVGESLRAQLERLLDRLAEATAPEAGILLPLQKALRCLNAEPEARDGLIGVIYDLVTVDEVDIEGLLMSIDGVVAEEDAASLLDYAADAAKVMRGDVLIQTQILGTAELILARPAIESIAPMLLELIETGVVREVVAALGRLLEGCGR